MDASTDIKSNDTIKAKGEDILRSLDQVDYCAKIWGQYLGGIARAVVEQYALLSPLKSLVGCGTK
jgi:hypothetical protein